MFRNLLGKKATRKSGSARTNRFRAQYDALEDRLAMSLFGGVAGGIVHVPTPIVFLPPATAVNLTVEPRNVVTGSLVPAKHPNIIRFNCSRAIICNRM